MGLVWNEYQPWIYIYNINVCVCEVDEELKGSVVPRQ